LYTFHPRNKISCHIVYNDPKLGVCAISQLRGHLCTTDILKTDATIQSEISDLRKECMYRLNSIKCVVRNHDIYTAFIASFEFVYRMIYGRAWIYFGNMILVCEQVIVMCHHYTLCLHFY